MIITSARTPCSVARTAVVTVIYLLSATDDTSHLSAVQIAALHHLTRILADKPLLLLLGLRLALAATHSRSRSRSRRDRANPLNQDPHRYIPPPYNGQQSVQQAASTVGGLSLSFKLPDIEVWKGNDDTKNYDKWRRSAIQKCESLPEDKQLAYLEMKVDGAAWQYIDDLKFEHYLDLLEGLDPYYARSTYEKVSEAQSQLADGSLKMGSSESFADWRGRFMSVCRLVKLPDSAMIGYARAFLRPGLAAAASHAFDDEQENALVKFLDAARKSDLTQKQINQGKTAADKPRTAAHAPQMIVILHERLALAEDNIAKLLRRAQSGRRTQWLRLRSASVVARLVTRRAIRRVAQS
ncbi:hypothetical protein A1F94_001545 [Pyrenophora tritici-repentis]|nr:hypothetical protein A1F94_001545 [Pyrenophora tritici-repentis]